MKLRRTHPVPGNRTFTSVRFLPLFVFASLHFVHSATYYVANAGSDQNAGKNDSAAFATLAGASTKVAAHDTLLLNRGDVFRDSLNLAGIAEPSIGAFGQANLPKPVVCGSIAITQWSVYQGQVWKAPCNKRIEKLFVNSAMMTLARYPDTGWLRIDTVTENSDGSGTIIRVAALSRHPRNTAQYWTNAQIRWRRWSWWFETRRIAAYDPTGRLSLEGKSAIHIMGDSGCKGWHFYIDNKLEELDAPGEWYYDSAAHTVYFFPPGGADPNTMLIEGSSLSNGIVLAGGSVDNICFRHQTLSGLSISKTSTVSNCRFEGIGGDQGGTALRASWDIANSRITGNFFENNLNIGISWYENSGRKGQTVIDHDTLLNTGTFPGYGGTGTWHAVGILVHLSSNVQVRNNYIDKTGYAGILLGSDSNFVYNNIIKRAMWTLNDGAAIYTDCNKSFIRNNVIYDTKGDLSSSGPWYPLGHGIWLEFLGDFRESVVESNTIVRSGCSGIFLPNNFSSTIRDNVLFDNAVTQMELDGQLTNTGVTPPRAQNLPQNNLIQGNVCYATTREQSALQFRPEFNYGSLQGNYFCNPFTDSVVSGYGTGNKYYTLSDYTLAQWGALFGWADKTAKTDPVKRPRGLNANNPYGTGRIFINESPDAKAFALGPGAYQDLDGNAVAGSLSVPPFASKVLVYCDSTSGVISKQVKRDGALLRQTKTSLEYRICSRSTVTLSVYTVSGRLVFRSCTTQGPGTYAVHFDRKGGQEPELAPGVYNYAFATTAPGPVFAKTGKVVIVR